MDGYKYGSRNQKLKLTSATFKTSRLQLVSVHCAGAANRTTDFRPVEHLVNNLADCAGAAAALGATAEAAIDMAHGT